MTAKLDMTPEKETAHPTMEFRWLVREYVDDRGLVHPLKAEKVLQQRWHICTTNKGYVIIKRTDEWRDVPMVFEKVESALAQAQQDNE